MFDIHIFTLYSLNQTILKEVKKKGKVRDTVLKGYKMLFLHISSQRTDSNMLKEANTSNIDTWATSRPFVSVPVPLDLRPPLDPTASMRKIGKQHLTHLFEWRLYQHWWEVHTKLKSHFLSIKGLRRSRHTGFAQFFLTQSKLFSNLFFVIKGVLNIFLL